MNAKKLIELYKSRAPSPLCSNEQIEKDIAFLLEYLTEEQIFFAINYLSKFHPKDLNKRVTAVTFHWKEIEKYYHIAKAKQGRKTLKESESKYDQKNYYKGANTPSWFGKSFDFNLFK